MRSRKASPHSKSWNPLLGRLGKLELIGDTDLTPGSDVAGDDLPVVKCSLPGRPRRVTNRPHRGAGEMNRTTVENKIALEENFSTEQTIGDSQEYFHPEKWEGRNGGFSTSASGGPG